jgi:hypothetical protein
MEENALPKVNERDHDSKMPCPKKVFLKKAT